MGHGFGTVTMSFVVGGQQLLPSSIAVLARFTAAGSRTVGAAANGKEAGSQSAAMYDQILIGVDGSEEAERAARRGLELADTVGASVTVLHVVERRTLGLTESETEAAALRERAADVLESVESIAAEVGQSVETTVREGSPAAEISAAAVEQDAELLVLGRQGLSGLGKRLLGGVTERLLNRGEVPVLVVPEAAGEPSGYRRLLLPTDGSDNAEAALPHGAGIASAYGATVDVLNVVDLQDAGGPFNAGGLESEFVERLEAEGADAVADAADDLTTRTPGIEVHTAVERTTSLDGAAAGISEYVDDHEVDLVVMGSRGRSNLKRKLLGSVASKVLRTVDVPVVAVPA